MPIELGRRLIATGVVSPAEVEGALFLSVVRGVSFPRALLDRGALQERALEEELERAGGLALRHVVAAPELAQRVPRAMCRRLAAVPVRVELVTGCVDIAAADPLDPHIGAEFAFHLGATVRVLRAPLVAIEEAIRRLELADRRSLVEESRKRRATPAFPHGAPDSSKPPPPPSAEETPIPLVRRVQQRELPTIQEGETIDESDIATRRRPSQVEDPSADVPVPLQHSKVPAELTRSRPLPPMAITPPPAQADGAPPPRPSSPSRTGPHSPAMPHSLFSDADAVEQTAVSGRPFSTPADRSVRSPPAVLRSLDHEPPSVSFPSEPPPKASSSHPIAIAPPLPLPNIAPPAPLAAPPAPIAPRAAAAAPIRKQTPRPALLADLHQPSSSSAPDGIAGALALGRDPAPAAAAATTEPMRVHDDELEPVPAAFALKPVRPVDGGVLFAQLVAANNRDDIVRLALRGMRMVARRVAIFSVKRDGFHGFACNVEFGDQDELKKVIVESHRPSILATASATGMYLGPVPATPAHAALLGVFDGASTDVAAVAVRVFGRTAIVMMVDDLDDTMMGTRFLDDLARRVGEALARLLSR